MSAFDYVYQELGIKCGLAWVFTTPSGLISLAVSVILAGVAMFFWREPICECGHDSEDECAQTGCVCGDNNDGPYMDGGI